MNNEELFEEYEETIPAWTLIAMDPDEQQLAIERSLQFKNFKEAFACISEIAKIAEQQNHHPDWNNQYNRLHICLYTHDKQAFTMKDVKLAQAIDALIDVQFSSAKSIEIE